MSLKNKLRDGAQKTLGVKHEQKMPVSLKSEIERLTQQIRIDLQEMEEIQTFVLAKRHRYLELRENVLKQLIYVRNHRKELGISSFESYLEQNIGLTKGYFYEQVQAYELCLHYDRPQLFGEIDYKILVQIARVKDPQKQKQLLGHVHELSRETMKKVSRADSLDEKISTFIRIEMEGDKTMRLEFAKALTPSQREEWSAFIYQKAAEFWNQKKSSSAK